MSNDRFGRSNPAFACEVNMLKRRGSLLCSRYLAQAAAYAILGFASASCGSAQSCSNLACEASAQLSGSVSVGSQTTLIDARWCVNGDCRTGQIDLSQSLNTLPWNTPGEGGVTLYPAGTSGAFKVAAFYFFDQSPPPSPAKAELTLSDHQSGVVLLEVTRSIELTATDESSCVVCWSGVATF